MNRSNVAAPRAVRPPAATARMCVVAARCGARGGCVVWDRKARARRGGACGLAWRGATRAADCAVGGVDTACGEVATWQRGNGAADAMSVVAVVARCAARARVVGARACGMVW